MKPLGSKYYKDKTGGKHHIRTNGDYDCWWEDFSPTQEQAETLLDKINEKYDPIEDFNPFPDDDFDSIPF